MTTPAPVPAPSYAGGVRSVADFADLRAELPNNVRDVVSRMVEKQPFFAVYMFNNMRLRVTGSVPTLATDGTYILINPEFFGKLDIDERLFVMCHEILHAILQHCQRSKAYNERGVGPDFKVWHNGRWNIITDHIINDMLVRIQCGSMPSCGLRDVSIATADDIADEKYHLIPEPPDDGDGGHGGFDEHLEPDASDQMSDAQTKRAIAEASNAAKAQGKMPAELDRIVGEILEPQQDWRKKFRDAMDSCMGTDAMTWRRPNKRKMAMAPHVYYPGKTGFRCGTIVLCRDTSGSVSDAEDVAYMSEAAAILREARPERMIVISVDTKVHSPDECTDPEELRHIPRKGGGGTDMRKGFDWARENVPDMSVFVCATDGWTPWPDDDHGIRSIWLVTDKQCSSPIGETIHLDVPDV